MKGNKIGLIALGLILGLSFALGINNAFARHNFLLDNNLPTYQQSDRQELVPYATDDNGQTYMRTTIFSNNSRTYTQHRPTESIKSLQSIPNPTNPTSQLINSTIQKLNESSEINKSQKIDFLNKLRIMTSQEINAKEDELFNEIRKNPDDELLRWKLDFIARLENIQPQYK